MGLDNSAYYKILKDAEWSPLSYKEIANSLMKNGVKQMYHAILNEDDIQFFFSIPNLDIFWCCRCHLVAKDGSTAHEHLHALVQYKKGTHRALKKRMQRAKQRFHPKTTFKRILCPDHAVGVLRYITCQDGQRKTKPQHTHYRRSVHGSWLLHKRSEKKKLGCADVRLGILRNLRKNLDEEWLKSNVSGHPHHLHHHETCLCEFGKIGREKKAAANQKRRDFYKTEQGQDIKKMYKDRAQNKKDIIKLVMDLKTGNNLAEVEKETILDLLKTMK